MRVPEVTTDVPRIDGPIPATPAPSDEGSEEQRRPTKLDDDDLKANPELASHILGTSVQARNWRTVRRVIAYYADIPGHDPLLALYARGALERQDGHHGRAIAAYREMLNQDTDLSYVRLDLAAMFFEDKQFGASRELFERLKRDPEIAPTAQRAIDQYLAAIGRQSRWSGTVRVGYKYNDNVNNASSSPYIYLNGFRFDKSPDSLPHSANAIAYYANLNRDFNLAGNHFLTVEGAVEGDHYWDDHDWSETTATLRAGYRYRNLKSWLSVIPSYSEAWLGGDPFRRTIGASIEYGSWIRRNLQIMGSYSWFRKKYDEQYDRYDGDLHAISATAVYFHSPKTIFYGGLTTQRDLLETKFESSSRDGASIGVIKQWKSGLNVRGNARYSYRKFHDYSLFSQTRLRRDHEYQFDLSVTHRKLGFAGIYPRLDYQHLRVDSSVSSLYSRTGNQFTLSLETSF